MVRKILHTAALFLTLLAVWYVLSGIATPLFLVFGVASSAFATYIALRMQLADREGHPFHLTFTAPLYWLWLFKEMVKSGWSVTRAVWSRNMIITPEFACIPIRQKSDLGRTIYANSMTLTPGTVCVNIHKDEVLFHALQSESVDELKSGEMDRRIARLTVCETNN